MFSTEVVDDSRLLRNAPLFDEPPKIVTLKSPYVP